MVDPRSQHEPEWLDRPDLAPEDRRRGIADLRRVNRFLFGHRAVVAAALEHLRPPARDGDGDRDGRALWLDVAAGAGDAGAAVVHAAHDRGIELAIVSLDREIAHLALGRSLGEVGAAVVGSAEALPFRDASFDVALSTLFFHHLDRDEKAAVAREMRRVARRGALIVDLVRSRWAPAALRLLFPVIGIGRIAREDGLMSLERASTFEEWRGFATSAGGGARRRFPARVSIALGPPAR